MPREADLGSTTENLLRLSPCNLLLVARILTPAIKAVAETTMTWTWQAKTRMARVPAAVQSMARQAVLHYAAQQGHTVITSDVIGACLKTLMPTRALETMTTTVTCTYRIHGTDARGGQGDDGHRREGAGRKSPAVRRRTG